jgi:hypothetical protein
MHCAGADLLQTLNAPEGSRLIFPAAISDVNADGKLYGTNLDVPASANKVATAAGLAPDAGAV